MAQYKEGAEAKIGLKTSSKAVYTEQTYQRLEQDAIYFRKRAAEGEIADTDKKRYARIVILLLAFYLEAISKLALSELGNKKFKVDKKQRSNESIQRFRAVCKECTGQDLTLDTRGIEDIFTIRNRIVAHPAGRAQSQTATGEDRWSRVDKNIAYKKFEDFPLHYSHFELKHADEILKETKDFVTSYLNLLGKKVPEERLKGWWPDELVKWCGNN